MEVNKQIECVKRPVEFDILVLQLVAVHVPAVRSFVCRVDRSARLQEGHQVAHHRDQPAPVPHLVLHDWHVVYCLRHIRLRQCQVAVVFE